MATFVATLSYFRDVSASRGLPREASIQFITMAESPTQSVSFAFPKSRKLCGETTVDRLFREGSGFSRFPLRVVYIVNDQPREGEAPLRMMVSVGKKRFKRAVKRNRVKRLVREAWRLRMADVEAAMSEANVRGLHVAFVFLSGELPSFADVDAAMSKAIDKLVSAISKPVAAEG